MNVNAGKRRNERVAILAVVVLVASLIGGFSYVRALDKQVQLRTDLARTICHRQDAVIAVLTYLTSIERQVLVQRRLVATPELKASNIKIRTLVRTIEASPCTPP